jgi:hypothetical protein
MRNHFTTAGFQVTVLSVEATAVAVQGNSFVT